MELQAGFGRVLSTVGLKWAWLEDFLQQTSRAGLPYWQRARPKSVSPFRGLVVTVDWQ